MKIVTYYSHLNGLEFLLVHKRALWTEIQNVITSLKAATCRTKVSKEIRTTGKLLYSPIAMNDAMKRAFAKHGWSQRRTAYWVTSDAKLIRKTLHMSPDQQKAEIEAAGLQPI